MSGEKNELIVGIDLGTTNSLVAVCDERGPVIIPDAEGRALLPSVVRYEGAARGRLGRGYVTVVGAEAKAAAQEFPLATVVSVKRLMGRSAEDAAPDARFVSYRVVAGERGTARVRVPLVNADGSAREVDVSPEEVSAEVLAALKAQAEAALGRPVRKAVVTVPAYFDDAQRQATRTAGRLAGLEVVRIVPEPTAAALAYGIGLERGAARNQNSTVVVYDLGGGTFDVSVLRLTPAEEAGGTAFFQVLATSGDTHLGGDDADHLIMDLFRREIAQVLGQGEGMEVPPGTRRQMVSLAEAVKCRLSERESADVAIDLSDGRVYRRTLMRAEFEAMIAPLVERTIESCRRALNDAKSAMAGKGIDAVILVGGSTRIPLVRRRVGEFFGIEPYTALNPDEVVALGAAVQASILSGRKGSLLLDVIPLSLGIETVGGAVAKLIVRNSTVPAKATEMFSTSVDGQTSVRFSVYQGEREMTADCRKLAEFHLRGIPQMPAGIPQIEVQFLVDANGVLNVSATERRSGKRASLQVIPNHGLTVEEIEVIEREAYAHAREDMTRHRVVDLIANSKLDLKWIGERLERHRAELDAAYRSELEGKIAALRQMVARAEGDWKSVDANEFHRLKEELDRGSVRLQEVGIAASLKEKGPT